LQQAAAWASSAARGEPGEGRRRQCAVLVGSGWVGLGKQ
jgi:hypothetical protein